MRQCNSLIGKSTPSNQRTSNLDTNPNVRQKLHEARCSASAQCLSDSSASAQCLSDSSASEQCLRIVRRTFAGLPDSPQNTSPDQICAVTSQKHVLYTSQVRKTLCNARQTFSDFHESHAEPTTTGTTSHSTPPCPSQLTFRHRQDQRRHHYHCQRTPT